MAHRRLTHTFTRFLRRRTRPLLLALITLFTLLEVLILSPASVEEGPDPGALDPEALVPKENQTLAPGIPKDRVPEYSVDKFDYVSSQGTEKQWKLLAEKAFLFHREKLVHTRIITAYLYDSDGKITTVTGLEGKYFMNQKDLEIFGDVKTVFPDGFTVRSPYLHYRPDEKLVDIPVQYPVSGNGGPEKSDQKQRIAFESLGLHYPMKKSRIFLHKNVRLTSESPDRQLTTIDSDSCTIQRDTQLATFVMNPSRPLKDRFVHITQPTLYTRARRAELNYGDTSKLLTYMTAFEDVLIKETRKDGTEPSLKYATSGRADFDAKRDIIILTEFPQVYQDNDTVTGERILLHRDTDVVEVDHSNAYSQGKKN